MKKLALASILSLLFGSILYSQSIPADSLYLGQTPPENTPKIFELSVTSGLRAVERITISTDGKEIYYSELNSWPATNKRIKCYKYTDSKWEGPFVVFEGYVCPALSVNDSIIYMQKDLNNIACTYYSKRNSTGWSTPSRLLSTSLQTHYFQKTNLGNYYLASTPGGNSDLCKLKINNTDTTIQNLGKPINTSAVENDFFIARDESFIIVFRLSTPYDLFISYNKGNGKWTNPKSLGVNINTSIYECCPFVTQDNKYLFFTRGGNYMPSYNTYWVKVDDLIENLKHTNFDPYLNKNISNLSDTVGKQFSYTLPDSVFVDDDGNNTLTYVAKLSNGNPLPTWLSFNPTTRTFSGTPTSVQTLNIMITATDNAGKTVSTTFNIGGVTAVNQIKLQDVKIFPNPSSGYINVTLDAISGKQAIIEICNLEGKLVFWNFYQNLTVTTIDLKKNNPQGMYLLKLAIDGKIITKKICLE